MKITRSIRGAAAFVTLLQCAQFSFAIEREPSQNVKIWNDAETNKVDVTNGKGLHVNLRNNAGTEIGTSLNPLFVNRTYNLNLSTDSVTVYQGTSPWVTLAAQSGTWTVQQGSTPTSIANAWPFKLTDGTNTMAVKAASTAPVATDTAGVVSLSPNSNHATAAGQTTGNNLLTAIDAGIPAALGQTSMANSMPIAIANDQTTLKTRSLITSGSVYGNLSIGTSPTEVKVGGSKLSGRCNVTFVVIDSQNCYFGFSNSVSTSNGTPIYQNQFFSIDVDANATVYLVCVSASKNARISENPCQT